MSGFINPDGSELIGGQKSGGTGQALQLDSSGNLLVNVAVGGGGGGGGSGVVNIADPTTSTNKLKVNSDGSINVNPSSASSSTAINDGTTTTQKASVDASGNLHTQETNSSTISSNTGNAAPGIGTPGDAAWTLTGNASEIALLKKLALLLNGGISLLDSGGINKLAIDASGRLIAIEQRRTDTVYNQTQSGISASGDTGDISVNQYSELAIDVNLTALTGTSVQFKVQRKDAFGNYTQLASNAALTAVGTTSFSVGSGMSSNLSIGDTIKVIWLCTSVTSATFTVSVKAK